MNRARFSATYNLQTLQFSFLFFSYDRIFAPSLSRNCSTFVCPEKIILSLTEDPTEKAWIRAWPSGSSF